MSPEQIQASQTDYSSDLWSFGVVLYEMLTGQLPFQDEYEAAVIYEILNEEPKAIQLLRANIPDKITSLVANFCKKDPVNRISSTEVIQSLTQKQARVLSHDDVKSIAVPTLKT